MAGRSGPRTAEGVGDLALSVLLAGGIVVLFAAASLVQRRLRLSHEVSRKLVHMESAVVAAAAPLLFSRGHLIATCAILLLALPLGASRDWFPGVVRARRSMVGPVWFLIAYVVLLVAEDDPLRIAAAELVLGFGDALACLVGRRFGRTRLAPAFSRTWVGTATFAAVAWMVVMTLAPFLGLDWATRLFVATAVAVSTAAIEALSPSAFDNFAVPLMAALLLHAGADTGGLDAVGRLVAMLAGAAVIGTALARTWISARVGFVALAALPLMLAVAAPAAGQGVRRPPPRAGAGTPAD